MPRTALLFSTAATDSVVTTMPSSAFAAQAGMSFGFPATETRQMRQFPTMGSLGYQQRVGTSTPVARAASRIVEPSGTDTCCPLIVSVGMATHFGIGVNPIFIIYPGTDVIHQCGRAP